jgi:hypothetical protein
MFMKEAARLSEASGASAIRIALRARRAVADLRC